VSPPRRTAGVLGGMGPAATLDFMARVQALRAGGRDQDHVRLIVDLNPAVPDRNAAVAGTGPSPGPALAEMARGLERAGADFLVMPCNAAHAFAGAIGEASALPFLDMIEATADAAKAAAPGAKRVGLLAASGCLDSGLYQRALAARGMEGFAPEGAAREAFMAGVYAVKAGELEAARAAFLRAAGELVNAGAELLIAGCTEVPLALDAGDAPVPLINSTQVLAEKTVAWATDPVA
jgi:aspartate racemase